MGSRRTRRRYYGSGVEKRQRLITKEQTKKKAEQQTAMREEKRRLKQAQKEEAQRRAEAWRLQQLQAQKEEAQRRAEAWRLKQEQVEKMQQQQQLQQQQLAERRAERMRLNESNIRNIRSAIKDLHIQEHGYGYTQYEKKRKQLLDAEPSADVYRQLGELDEANRIRNEQLAELERNKATMSQEEIRRAKKRISDWVYDATHRNQRRDKWHLKNPRTSKRSQSQVNTTATEPLDQDQIDMDDLEMFDNAHSHASVPLPYHYPHNGGGQTTSAVIRTQQYGGNPLFEYKRNKLLQAIAAYPPPKNIKGLQRKLALLDAAWQHYQNQLSALEQKGASATMSKVELNYEKRMLDMQFNNTISNDTLLKTLYQNNIDTATTTAIKPYSQYEKKRKQLLDVEPSADVYKQLGELDEANRIRNEQLAELERNKATMSQEEIKREKKRIKDRVYEMTHRKTRDSWYMKNKEKHSIASKRRYARKTNTVDTSIDPPDLDQIDLDDLKEFDDAVVTAAATVQ